VIAKPKLRSIAIVAIALASVTGIAARLAMSSVDAPQPEFGVREEQFRGQEPFRDALVDGIETSEIAGVRIRLPRCSQPVFVVPLGMLSVTQPRMADRFYGQRPSYHATDVFAGTIRQGFSPVSRLVSYLAARAFRGEKALDIGLFIRFYSPSDCAIEPAAFLEWAQAVLKFGSGSARSNSDR
jgi:hypothetical protein